MSALPTRNARLRLELLEDRAVPAVFGQPWSDPERLTLSFAPQNTPLAGLSSNLYSALDAQMPRATWQRLMAQALQVWATQANINLGFVADTGMAFGTGGMTQGDTRFGDIRIGSHPMAADALAVAVPFDPFLSGTWAGDVFLNSATTFSPGQLYRVMLHEAGHVLGLPESNDPTSIMYPRPDPPRPLSPQDIAAVRQLYGTRTQDVWDAKKSNQTLLNATRIKFSESSDGYTGATPLVTFGDVTTTQDVDHYWIKPLTGYTGPMTFRLQTRGISLMAPSLTLMNGAGQVLGRSVVTDPLGGTVTLRLSRVVPGTKYYLRVDGATNDMFGIGRYALVSTFDTRLKTSQAQIQAFLRQAPSTYEETDDAIFTDLANALLEPDAGTDDTALLAPRIDPTPTPRPNTLFQALGTIESATDVDFYRVRSQKNNTNQPVVLTVSLNRAQLNGTLPKVELFDDDLNPLDAEVFVNGNGRFAVQASGLRAGKDVYLRVSSAGGQTGNYLLTATFGDQAATSQGFAIDSVTAAQPTKDYRLFLGQSQLMQFSLTGSSAVAGTTSTVRFDLRNAAGQLVATLRAKAGETVTADGLFLPPGPYTATVTLEPGTNGVRDPMDFRLVGLGISTPIGPTISNPLLTPQYVSPTDPTQFLYPGPWPTTDPFLWTLLDPGGFLLLPGATPATAYPVINGVVVTTRP